MDIESAMETTGQALRNAFKGMSDEMQLCIQNCISCSQICEQLVSYCLQKGGAHAAPAHIRLLLDCANICATSSHFMVRGSDFHYRTCGVCAEICFACAVGCERFTDDELMKNCAEMCRRCADSCQKMAKRH